MSTAVAEASSSSRSRFALTQDEVDAWEKNGFLGPYTACTAEEMDALRPILFRAMHNVSRVYGFKTLRDHHLDCRACFDLCRHPAIVERIASIYGPDLLLWRSNFFHKSPGGGPVDWHFGGWFPGHRNVPAIDPAENVTCWFALTRATRANGCMKVIPGSHKNTFAHKKVDEGGLFDKVLDGLDPSDAVYIELEPGQFFFFNEKLVHSSEANGSDTERSGIAIRITPTSTRVYPNQKVDGQGMHLKNWHAILVSGEDRYGHNRLGPPPTEDFYPAGALRKALGRIRYHWQSYWYSYSKLDKAAGAFSGLRSEDGRLKI